MMEQLPANKWLNGHLEDFQAVTHEPDWMLHFRKNSFEKFQKLGWPSKSLEKWRRTDISGLHLEQKHAKLPEKDMLLSEAPGKSGLGGYLAFLDGSCILAALKEDLKEMGVLFSPLSWAIQQGKEKQQPRFLSQKIREIFNAGLEQSADGILPWHYSLWTHGAILYIPANFISDQPFEINMLDAESNGVGFPHIIIIAESGANAQVVLKFRNTPDAESISNSVVDIRLGEDAQLELLSVSEHHDKGVHFNNTQVHMGSRAKFHQTDVTLSGKLVKSGTHIQLAGREAVATVDGLVFADANQQIDIDLHIDHQVPQTSSRTTYKNAAKNGGRTIFQGDIFIHPNAQQTKARLANRNLLLDAFSRADSVPSLNIKADDVECSHASTTGKVDESQLFYLMSRGFPKPEAETAIVHGFFKEILDGLPNALNAEKELILRKIS